MELKILDWIQIIHVSWLDKLMVGITTLGNGGIIWIVSAAALLIIPKMRKAGTAMAVSLALEVLCCNVILKPLIARIRPCDVNAAVHLLIRRPADFSFPSGHTGAALDSGMCTCGIDGIFPSVPLCALSKRRTGCSNDWYYARLVWKFFGKRTLEKGNTAWKKPL